MKNYLNMPAKKQKALLLLTRQVIDETAPDLTYDEIAEQCNISSRQLFRWRTQDREFQEARKELMLSYSNELVGDAFAALRWQLKKKKSVKASEVLLKSQGMLIDKKEVTADINATVHDTSEQDNDELKRELEELQAKLGVNKSDEE